MIKTVEKDRDIRVKHIGTDDWDREVYQNIVSGRIYKKYNQENTYYTASNFDGEPEFPLKDSLNVIVLKDTFEPTCERYQKYAGETFTFIREIDAEEGYDESLRMFLIHLENGKEIPAFKEEIEL